MNQAKHVTLLFFILLSVGLFLGDGKQGVIDVYSASVVLVCWAYYFIQHRKIRIIPAPLHLPWLAFCVAALASSVSSDSIGVSVSWLVRLACGYLIYRLFFTISDKQQTHAYLHGGLVITCAAVLLSMASALFRPLREMLPSMNLIDVRYGHSHLADLLVFVAPAIWYVGVVSKLQWPTKIMAFIVYAAALLLTFARGAWLLVVLFFGLSFVFLTPKERIKRAIITLFCSALLIGVGYLGGKTIPMLHGVMRPQTVSARVEYWRQALVAFRERPFFGSGPGTFALESKRLQAQPGQFSWFAHSQPLQVAAEMGLVGLLAFLWLIYAHGALVLHGKIEKTVFWAVALVFAYGLFEFVLDYQIVWLLFWAGVGLMAGKLSESQPQENRLSVGIVVPLGFIVVFYVLWTASSFITLTTKRYDFAFYAAPFDAVNAVVFLSNQSSPLHSSAIDLIIFFHKKNPAVLSALSENIQKNNPKLATLYAYQAYQFDSKNLLLFKSYIKMLKKSGGFFAKEDLKDLPRLFYNQIAFTHPRLATGSATLLANLGDTNDEGVNTASKDLLDLKDEQFLFTKAYYLWGLSLGKTHPASAREALLLATRIVQSWSYLYLELASHMLYEERDPSGASAVLRSCLEQEYAKDYCIDFSLETLPRPGYFKKEILEISY